MINAILFDFGGVMHDVSGLEEERFAIHQALSIKEDDLKSQQIRTQIVKKLGAGQITEKEYWEELSEKLGVPIPENHHDLHRKVLRERSEYYPQMFELVERLKEAAFLVYVLSNSIPPHAEVIKEKGWYDPFHHVLLSQDIGFNKPDKEAFSKALQILKLKAEETLFIDDREENVISAQKLGMTTIHAKNPDQVVKAVEELLHLG